MIRTPTSRPSRRIEYAGIFLEGRTSVFGGIPRTYLQAHASHRRSGEEAENDKGPRSILLPCHLFELMAPERGKYNKNRGTRAWHERRISSSHHEASFSAGGREAAAATALGW